MPADTVTVQPRRLVLSGARLFEPTRGNFTEPTSVIMEGDAIIEMRPGTMTPDGVTHDLVVDARGKHILPGLIDAHFHLVSRSAAVVDDRLISSGMIEGVVNARERLEGGVTTVRDAGCRHHGIHELAAAIAAGLIPGPRAFVAGRNPAGPGAPGHWRNAPVTSADELRTAVRAELAMGAHWVKFILSHAEDPAQWARVTTFFSAEELRAGIEEAHAHGARTGVHCEGYEPAALAVRCGIDALDHAPQLDAATADLMAARGVHYVPTLWAFTADCGIDLESLSTERADAVRRGQEEHRASVRRALRAGVTIAAGTDAAGSLPPRDVLVHEMKALADAGLTTAEALRAATVHAAQVLGQEARLGEIEPGMAADLVIVDGDPLRDLSALVRPLLVVSRGRIVVDNWSPGRSRVAPETVPGATASVTGRWTA
ncbi:MAG TPA: amidohydrolase family protein [Spirochaetia bacterium]|nr:amidohydrolase family protein [Spirochaetia bacterium]